MQSVAVHQEVPKAKAAVKPVGGQRKRRGERNLVAGRSQNPKGRIQASCESRKRLTVAGKGGMAEEKHQKGLHQGQGRATTQRLGPFKRNLRTHHEGKRGIKIQAASGRFTWEGRGQQRSASEGGAQDSYHLWEEEDRPARVSRRS
jgi:hypothetical protein